MLCHIMMYMRLVLTTLVSITCLLGDNFVELTQHPLLKALVDNGTHATIGALTGIAFAMQYYDKTTNIFGWLLIFISFICSSLIDIDHFIAARSWSLEDATSLSQRPFLHCSTIIGILFILFVCTSCLNYFKFSLIIGAVLCAFITHHTRDAMRRGYWLCPFGHTNKITNVTYILITIITPYLLNYTHNLCRIPIVQQFVGYFIKIDNDSHYCNNRSGYRYMTV